MSKDDLEQRWTNGEIIIDIEISDAVLARQEYALSLLSIIQLPNANPRCRKSAIKEILKLVGDATWE